MSSEREAKLAAAEWVYLDTETTGLSPASKVVQIALVAEDGHCLLDTLVDPCSPIPADATRIHGITDDQVKGAPTLEQLRPLLRHLVRDRLLVIYNAQYDLMFLPELREVALTVYCAMCEAQEAMGLMRWPRLSAAAAWAGHDWGATKAHSAFADALAARSVWLKIQEP